MKKLLVIGIDGMEPRLVEHWLHRLPNLRQLANGGVLRPIKSVFPPDSLPAWTTIYTGKPPGEHGLFETIDYVTSEAGDLPRPDRFAGRTFWDEAGRRGKRVCIVNAFMAYPVWPVNGVMVSGPVFVSGKAQSHPPEILGELPKAELGGMVAYPYRWELGRFASRTATVARQQAALAKTLMATCGWDLFFLCLLTLDRVQHFFWRFQDPSDPAYPGPNPYQRVIFEHYRLMDQIVGELATTAGREATVLVLSDHGHGLRDGGIDVVGLDSVPALAAAMAGELVVEDVVQSVLPDGRPLAGGVEGGVDHVVQAPVQVVGEFAFGFGHDAEVRWGQVILAGMNSMWSPSSSVTSLMPH